MHKLLLAVWGLRLPVDFELRVCSLLRYHVHSRPNAGYLRHDRSLEGASAGPSVERLLPQSFRVLRNFFRLKRLIFSRPTYNQRSVQNNRGSTCHKNRSKYGRECNHEATQIQMDPHKNGRTAPRMTAVWETDMTTRVSWQEQESQQQKYGS